MMRSNGSQQVKGGKWRLLCSSNRYSTMLPNDTKAAGNARLDPKTLRSAVFTR